MSLETAVAIFGAILSDVPKGIQTAADLLNLIDRACMELRNHLDRGTTSEDLEALIEEIRANSGRIQSHN